ncbi:magnesium transporter CorA family protein [Spirillospora sp. NPDC048911]|uniref:magnesium transporter CorA family protein n=1 Tax=Spirillospora sp. NPDC048911 TaxID=3364527 RepID=UPI003722F821
MVDLPSEVDPAAQPGDRLGTRPPHTRAWRDGKVEAEGFPVAEISDYLDKPGHVVWLDLCGPDHDGLRVVADELGLDPIAIEDAVSRHERTKLDRYGEYAFLNVYAPECADGGIVLHEVSAFITDRALVTVRQDTGFDVDALVRRWDDTPDIERPELAAHGVPYLLYNLLDMVVDAQLDAVQVLDAEADDLGDLVFDDKYPVRDVQRRSFDLRRNLVALRKVALPMRELVNTLLRRDLAIVQTPLVPYYQDVYDHTMRVAEFTDSLRDMVGNLLDTRIALQGNRLNEVMKKVTSWAAIIAVPTAVTGFYGQNVPYPGSGAHWGFVVSTVVMIACSVTLYLVFKLRDWL